VWHAPVVSVRRTTAVMLGAFSMPDYLYLIKCNEFYKIGSTNNVSARVDQLQTGNPYPLIVDSYYKFDYADSVERCLHSKFKNKRVSGEWFNLENDDLQMLATICNLLDGEKCTQEIVIADEETDDELIEEPNGKSNSSAKSQFLIDMTQRSTGPLTTAQIMAQYQVSERTAQYWLTAYHAQAQPAEVLETVN
jgi:hypothetical protein